MKLTDHQARILMMVAMGNSNKRIATALSITENTVKNHMTEIMDRLQANDRAHAVFRYFVEPLVGRWPHVGLCDSPSDSDMCGGCGAHYLPRGYRECNYPECYRSAYSRLGVKRAEVSQPLRGTNTVSED